MKMTRIKDMLGYDFRPAKTIDDLARETVKNREALIKFRGKYIYLHQYFTLGDITAQYSKTPEQLFNAEFRLRTKNHKITKIDTIANRITTPDYSLTLPKALTHLEVIYCGENELEHLNIPPELNRLREIYCRGNILTELYLSPTLTELEILSCNDNRLTRLEIPQTLKKLEEIYCHNNELPEQRIQELIERGIKVHR